MKVWVVALLATVVLTGCATPPVYGAPESSSKEEEKIEEEPAVLSEEFKEDVFVMLYPDILDDYAMIADSGIDMYNKISKIWYDAISENYSAETAKYVVVYKGTKRQYNDFNDALDLFFEEETTKNLLNGLENLMDAVDELVLKLIDLEIHEKETNALLALRSSCVSFTDSATKPRGSYYDYTSRVSSAYDDLLSKYDTAMLYLKGMK